MAGLVQQIPGVKPASVLFLILTLNSGLQSSISTVREALAGVEDMAKNAAFRGQFFGDLSVNVGIGSNAWDKITGDAPRPSELHPFQELKGFHTAPSTPGDILFHVKAGRHDLVYEFERELMDAMGDAVRVYDMEYTFPYWDARNLQEFVDGTANPVGEELPESVFVTVNEDKNAAGGAYVITQRYRTNLTAWNLVNTKDQEAIFGRTKPNNRETSDAGENEQKSHRQLNTIIVNGTEHQVFRDALSFGSPAQGTAGCYFIAYSRYLWVLESMLRNMFIGVPEGKYDRLLDFVTPKTGNVFFLPTLEFLKGLAA